MGIGAGLGPLWLSLQLALVTTTILLVVGTPLAWWLAHTHARWKPVLEATVALQLAFYGEISQSTPFEVVLLVWLVGRLFVRVDPGRDLGD